MIARLGLSLEEIRQIVAPSENPAPANPPLYSRVNGKAERFIQTLLRERAYAYCYPNSDARTHELPFWIERYNFYRPHSAIGKQPPASRLGFIRGYASSAGIFGFG